MNIRVLIVDDEIHARRGLHMLLADQRDVEIVGEATDGQDAVRAIVALQPDLVFLDVEMPGLNGIEVIREVGVDAMPAVIFVTAYDQYAIAAFDASAVDYLLKPFTDTRFAKALRRAREQLQSGGVDDTRLEALVERLAPPRRAIERFTVKSGDTLRVFDVGSIDWIEADEYYSKLHIGDEVHLVRNTMKELAEELPGDRFARIHRSTIVNLDRVTALEPLFQGDFTVILKGGQRLRMSRRRRDALAGRLKHFA